MVRAPMGFETRQERSEQGAGNEEGKIMSRSTTHSFASSLPPSVHPLFSFFLFFSHHPLQKPKSEIERVREKKKKKGMYAKGSNLETNVCRMINCYANGVCVPASFFLFPSFWREVRRNYR